MRRPAPRLISILACLVLAGACGSTAPSPSASTSSPSPSNVAAASPSGAPTVSCVAPSTPASHDWNDRTWYEVFVRSFADADGDGTGDLRGLTAKLDYLNDGNPATTDDLGVGGLWLMPITEAASYHGYDVVDYEAVERDYGTRADLDALVAGAHERGMKVIVDLVLNHTSVDNPWFRSSAAGNNGKRDWYLWQDQKPSWLGPDGQVVWHERDGDYYYGVFWEGMPDLNLRNEAVTAKLQDVARFWLADVGVDGFRVDAAKHLIEDGPDAQTNTPETKAWLEGFKTAVEADKPGALLVGEVWDPASIAGGYVPDSLDMTFDFGLATAYRLALQSGRAAPIRTAFGDTATSWPANQSAAFLANHDQTRIMTELQGDPAAAKLAAFLLLAGPGTPFLYYGEEIGMTGTKPDERIRTPMRWTPDSETAGFTAGEPWEALSDDDPATINVQVQAADPHSVLSTYRELIAARSANEPLRRGATTMLDADAEPVVAWLRTTTEGTMLAIGNLSDAPVTGYTLSLDAGPLCGPQATALVASVGDGDPATAVASPQVNADGGVDAWTPIPELPPRSGYLIRLEPAP